MKTENYRVQDKGNVHANGKKTSFKLFTKRGEAFFFSGEFFAPGWDLTDEQCIASALKQDEDDQYGEDK